MEKKVKVRQFTSVSDWVYEESRHAERQLDRRIMTVPDEAYTPKELLEKFSRNQKVDVQVNEQYSMFDREPTHDDMDLQELANADPVERRAAAHDLKADIAKAETAFKSQEAKRKAKLDEEKADREFVASERKRRAEEAAAAKQGPKDDAK